jgi:hypothetical protein
MLAAIGHALMMSFAMTWEILWALILGFGLLRGCRSVCNVLNRWKLASQARYAPSSRHGSR